MKHTNVLHAGQTSPSMRQAKSRIGLRNLFKTIAIALASAAAFAVAPGAQAGSIDFENFDPNIYTGGDSFSQSGYTMTVADAAGSPGGLSGAVLNGADDFTCFIIACPAGNGTRYFAGLNDGGLSIQRGGLGFRLTSLDFGFILPIAQPIDFSVGQLVLLGTSLIDGSIFGAAIDFASQVDGVYTFANWNIGGAFASTMFSSISINACLYTNTGSCINPAQNQAQFALDNLSVTDVPEPASILLMVLGLAGLAVAARRRNA